MVTRWLECARFYQQFKPEVKTMTATTQVAYEDDLDYEIVNGHKEVKMAGARHGRIGGESAIQNRVLSGAKPYRRSLYFKHNVSHRQK